MNKMKKLSQYVSEKLTISANIGSLINGTGSKYNWDMCLIEHRQSQIVNRPANSTKKSVKHWSILLPYSEYGILKPELEKIENSMTNSSRHTLIKTMNKTYKNIDSQYYIPAIVRITFYEDELSGNIEFTLDAYDSVRTAQKAIASDFGTITKIRYYDYNQEGINGDDLLKFFKL